MTGHLAPYKCKMIMNVFENKTYKKVENIDGVVDCKISEFLLKQWPSCDATS